METGSARGVIDVGLPVGSSRDCPAGMGMNEPRPRAQIIRIVIRLKPGGEPLLAHDRPPHFQRPQFGCWSSSTSMYPSTPPQEHGCAR